MDVTNLGSFLRGQRKKQKLSLRKVASQAGVSATYLWEIELGKRKTPSAEILKKLAPILGVTTQELLERAGYLEQPEDLTSHTERLKWAVNLIVTDPAYGLKNRVDVNELTPEMMAFIIELYEKTTGKKLL